MERETQEKTKMDLETLGDGDAYSPSKLKIYEAQFFGFTPQTCVLRACNAFRDCLYDILPVVEKVCVRQLSKGESAGEEEQLQAGARECSRKLQQFLEERFQQLSERMEPLLVEQCFSLPPNVVLPEDQCHNKYPQNIQEVLKLESSIADLQTAYEAEICARQALLAELEEQKEAQKQLEEILAWIRELQGAWIKEGNSSFHESFRLVMESAQKLQKNIRDICKKTDSNL